MATRAAEEADVAAVCAFGEAYIRPHYEPLIGVAAAERQVRDWWNARVIDRAVADRAIIVAESRDGLIGVAQFSAGAQPPTVYKLYVHPAWRGRGVGSILLDAVIRSLPADTTRIAVEHFAANERAGSFYDREGFVIDHVSEDRSGDPALAIVWRIKTLA